MHDDDDLRPRLVEAGAQVFRLRGLPPGVPELVDIGAEGRRHRAPAIAERPRRDHENAFARRQEVHERGLERTRAGRGEEQDVVLGAAHLLQPPERSEHELAEVRPAVMDDRLGARLDETGAEVVLVVHSETSTGVVADVQALARTAQEADTLVVVDAVSSLGAVPLETDAWGIDVVVAGSQKALMTPPGLSLTTVSQAAWERSRRSTLPRYYFDWERMRAALEGGSTPFTPAVTVVASLDVSLGLLLEEGLEAAFARHAALGRACREGAKAMGLELYSPDEERSAVVTAILTPDGVDARELVLELRNRFGITVAGAHGELGSRMFRIGHIGYYDVLDITTALTAVEALLLERGAAIEPGVATPRALEAYDDAARV